MYNSTSRSFPFKRKTPLHLQQILREVKRFSGNHLTPARRSSVRDTGLEFLQSYSARRRNM